MEEYDLSVELFERFNLSVFDMIPLKNSFTIYTDKGIKMLKKINYDICELQFIDQALSFINNKFTRLPSFEKDFKGDIYTVFNKKNYCILNIKEGNEFKYDSEEDLEITIESLAEFHLASKGFKPDVLCRNNCSNLILDFRKKRRELILYEEIIRLKNTKNELDRIFIDNIDYSIHQIDEGIKILNESSYSELCSDYEKIAVCGNEHFYSDIAIEEHKAYFNNFDNFNINLRVYDIYSLINKLIKRGNFNYDFMKKIVFKYDHICRLDCREMGVIYGMLSFPYDFYNIFRKYSLTTENIYYSNLLLKAKNNMENMDKREELLKKMRL